MNKVIAGLIGVAAFACMPDAGAAEASCAPAGGLGFLCGIQNPEDIVQIPGTRLLIASSMAPGGGLHLVDTERKSSSPLFPRNGKFNHDTRRYPACPGAVDAKAAFHGLSLRRGQGNLYTLYATQHGSRESVEVFEVDTAGGGAAVTWVGCVTMPDKLAANSVASFSDGSIAATVLIHPGQTFGDSLAKRNTGAVYLWKPGSSGFVKWAGTDLPSNNGIDVSPDDSEFYVASSGLKQIVVFSNTNPAKRLRHAEFKDFTPDNVHWTSDGRLISAGMIDDEPACGGPPKADANGGMNLTACPRGAIAAVVDPKTMQITEVARSRATPSFNAAASAVLIGGEVWISSFHADRLAYQAVR